MSWSTLQSYGKIEILTLTDACQTKVNSFPNKLLTYKPKGQDEVNITIEIKADDTPEVAETFTVNLVNVSGMDTLQVGAVSITSRRWGSVSHWKPPGLQTEMNQTV